MPDAVGTGIYVKAIYTCATGESRRINTIPARKPTWKPRALPCPSLSIDVQKTPKPQFRATMQQIEGERAKRWGPATTPKSGSHRR